MVILKVGCCLKVVKKVECKKIVVGLILFGKLLDCVGYILEEFELFIVEGDFVGGLVK